MAMKNGLIERLWVRGHYGAIFFRTGFCRTSSGSVFLVHLSALRVVFSRTSSGSVFLVHLSALRVRFFVKFFVLGLGS